MFAHQAKSYGEKNEAYFSSESRMTVEAQPFRDSRFRHKWMMNEDCLST